MLKEATVNKRHDRLIQISLIANYLSELVGGVSFYFEMGASLVVLTKLYSSKYCSVAYISLNTGFILLSSTVCFVLSPEIPQL